MTMWRNDPVGLPGLAAIALGLFGAPSLVTGDGELFWGDDRLEQGLDWAAGRRPAAA